ncbi:MAG: MerR family transcriptional regulator, partial [Chloroflexi bacterium]|nr:MerR family transcriptional regulator [Chloroflexota bacterium]
MAEYGQNGNEPLYNLKAVIKETGLKPDTLRAWERRYGLPHPQRTAGGHRLYSQNDIDTVKWLIARQREGLSISRAVDLWQSLEQEGKDPFDEFTEESSYSLTDLSVEGTITELRERWIDACMAFNEQEAKQILTQAFAIYPPETVCIEMLQKGIRDIGQEWYEGNVTVQQEHFASAQAMGRLEALVAAAPPPTRAGRLIVACPPEEMHTFSPLLLTLLLRRRGWEVIYLGANVPIVRLEHTLSVVRPHLAILVAQLLHTAANLLDMGQFLEKHGITYAYGGLIFNQLPDIRRRISGYFLGEDLLQAPDVVDELVHSPPDLEYELVSERYERALRAFRENRSLIEVGVWDNLRFSDIPHAHLASASANMGQSIIAALRLGDMDFLGKDLSWVEGMMVNHMIPVDQLYEFIQAYQGSLEYTLG